MIKSQNIIPNLFNDIHWRVEESTTESLLIYHFRDKSEKSIQDFLQRIARAKYKLCVTNMPSDFHGYIDDPHIVFLEDNEIKKLEETFLNFFYPIQDDVFFIGVTGTNGKTTTVDLIRQIAIMKNLNILTIGTLGVYLNNDRKENFSLTTPSYIDLRKTIFTYQKSISVVAMELSSIALEQQRTGSILFDALAWTNFSQDHLDYHGTLENYFAEKRKIFNIGKNGVEVFVPKTQIAMTENFLADEKFQLIDCNYNIKNPFFKIFYNKENLSLAISCLKEKVSTIKPFEIENLIAPPGRANIIPYKNSVIVIDYAHTPDGIVAITQALRNSFPDKKLVTVFGCGGDRDRTKRPLMARAAEQNSDFVFLTSDNTRFEDPVQILNDARQGFVTENYREIIDRKDAIAAAMKLFDNMVLLIAGKGHENYLDVKGIKHPYNDFDYVMGLIHD